jgi:hypothetical protein
MKQSHTYRRGKEINIDPNALTTYQYGVAMRIQKRTRGRIRGRDALELAIVPAFFLWLFRKPRAYFKKKRIDRKLRKKFGGTNSGKETNK